MVLRIMMSMRGARLPSDLRVSFAFEDVVNDVPTSLHFATGCNEGRFTRFRLIAGPTNVRGKFRLNVGGRVALIGAKDAVYLCNSRCATHGALCGVCRDALFA